MLMIMIINFYTIVQKHIEQYQECNCSAATQTTTFSMEECMAGLTTRAVCQDEVIIAIMYNSNTLNSALSFEPDTTYYLISEYHYSVGIQIVNCPDVAMYTVFLPIRGLL